jgi:DNA-directed RNA polymerase specialized sigma24 family protein
MPSETENLEAIKKLLILLLRHQGVSDELISKASGINAKTIRNTFPLGKRKEVKEDGKKA